MDPVSIFESFALPTAVIISCFAALYFVFTKFMARLEQKDEQIQEMNKTHADEMNKWVDAINHNSVVMERLCTLLGDREDKNGK